MNDIFIGVFSGILTSAFIFLIVQLFYKVLLPWYQQVIYNGIDISGEWHSTVTPFPQDIKIEITQQASQISGLATYVNHPENKGAIEQIRTFRFDGCIIDRFVQLTLHHTDKSRIGVITYLLQVVGDGRSIEGSSSFYDLVQHRVSHASIAFCRDKKTTVIDENSKF